MFIDSNCPRLKKPRYESCNQCEYVYECHACGCVFYDEETKTYSLDT